MSPTEPSVAVVTGASHGLGRETAFRLAEKGWIVRGMGLGTSDLAETRAQAKQRRLDVEVIE